MLSKLFYAALAGLSFAGSWADLPPPAPSLVGAWQLRQVSFVAERPLSHELQEQLDDSAVAVLNQALRQGHTRQLVSFRPDGTYYVAQYENSSPTPAWIAAGTYRVAGCTLTGTGAAEGPGSLLAQSRIRKLTTRQLVLDVAYGADSLRVFKQFAYLRQLPR